MREPFLDLRIRLTDARGRLLQQLAHRGHRDVEVAGRLAEILAHWGNLLLRLEDSWAGLTFNEVEGEAG